MAHRHAPRRGWAKGGVAAALILAVALAVGCARPAVGGGPAVQAAPGITILHTNDTAGYVDPCG